MALKLSTFSLTDSIATSGGKPTTAFLTWINGVVKSIQSAFNDLSQFTSDIAYSIEQAGIAVKTAKEAQDTANANLAATNLANSYVSPSDVLSAATDTITVSDHNRIYGDGATVAVKGGTISGLTSSTTYYVVYQDEKRAGGTVTYTVVTVSTAAGQTGNQHLVGSITTPATGATQPASGTTTPPPGVAGLSPSKEQEIEDAQGGSAADP